MGNSQRLLSTNLLAIILRDSKGYYSKWIKPFSAHNNYKVGNIIIPILKMRKLRYREVEELAQIHNAIKFSISSTFQQKVAMVGILVSSAIIHMLKP